MVWPRQYSVAGSAGSADRAGCGVSARDESDCGRATWARVQSQDVLVLRRAVWHAYLAGDNDMNVLDGWRGDLNVSHALREEAHPALQV